jgi:hypothetical protein
MNKNLLKNIWAVVAGFFTVFILSVGTDLLLSAVGIFPSMDDSAAFTDWMYAFALAYSCFYTGVGGYLTAKLSVDKPWRQVYFLAGLGFISGFAGAYINWDKAIGHEWFSVAVVVTGPIFVWLGGKYFLKK